MSKTDNKIVSSFKKFKEDVKFNSDSFKLSELENNKLMIALGFYSAILKELTKKGYEQVEELDLVNEHYLTHQTVNNFFNFSKNTLNNLCSISQTREKRLKVYLNIEKLYKFCIENKQNTLIIKVKQGLFKKKMELNLEEELQEINRLKKECEI